MTRVLVVEDDAPMLRTLTLGLEASGFAVEPATTGGLALALVCASSPDVVLVDLGLPDFDGFDVIDGIRGWNDVPVIVVSARIAESEKVRALNAGADDYLTKPFGMGELTARIRAVTRAVNVGSPARVVAAAAVVSDDLTLDFDIPVAKRGIEVVHLTPIEWALARELVAHPGQVITHAALLRDVWGIDEPDKAHYVRFHMAALRRKLESDPTAPRYFLTERGVGFIFTPPIA